MKRLKILLVTWLLFGFAFARFDSRSFGENADLVWEKERRFRQQFPGSEGKPRIIVAGGSNAFWGMDSEALSKIARMPVINLSLPSEGDDPALMRIIALNAAKSGDLIIYSSMDFWVEVNINRLRANYAGKRLGLTDYVLAPDELSWRQRLDHYWKLFPSEVNPAEALRQVFFQRVPSSDYFTKSNAFGDFVGCVPQPVTPFKKDDAGNYKKFAKEFLEFRRKAELKGVRVINVAPWILVAPEEIEQWTAYYRGVLTELSGNPNPRGYPGTVLRTNASEFCDTNAHLVRELAKVRVEKHVALRLKKAKQRRFQGLYRQITQ